MPSQLEAVRVLIVADDPLARAGLATLLSDLPELVVAGRVSSSDDVAAALETYQPDVLLWDMGWQAESALARLADRSLTAPVVALVNDEEDARHAWRAGAQGLLRRDAEPPRLAAALAAAAQDMLIVDDDFRAAVGASPTPGGPPMPLSGDEPGLIEQLTPRELEVLRLLAKGMPNKTIALRLDISEHTVKFHVNSLLGKLGAGSRTEAVVRATRLGLIFL